MEKKDGRGRQVGWRKVEGVRKQRQLRAYDDEWAAINRFAHELKKGDRNKCLEFISSLDR